MHWAETNVTPSPTLCSRARRTIIGRGLPRTDASATRPAHAERRRSAARRETGIIRLIGVEHGSRDLRAA